MDTTHRQQQEELSPTGQEITDSQNCKSTIKGANDSEENMEADSTIHGFNMSNVTVIERQLDNTIEIDTKQLECTMELVDTKIEITNDVDANEKLKTNSCEGSDSGVEVLETADNCSLQRTLSANSENVHDFRTLTPAQSYDSSIISYGSNYDEAYNILARRNSTLFEDYKLRNGDGTSEGGSESSSVTSTREKRSNLTGTKKKVCVNEKTKNPLPSGRSRTKPLLNQKHVPNSPGIRGKSAEKIAPKTPNQKITTTRPISVHRTKPTPDTLAINNQNVKKDIKRSLLKQTSVNKTPSVTPTDDGRWPSVNSKPAPLLTRSFRGTLPIETPIKTRLQSLEAKNTLEKYGTLPRRRKEKSADNIKDLQKKPNSRDSSATRSALFKKQNSREGTPAKTLPPYPRKKPIPKTKIYHETSVQTAWTIDDIEKALSGLIVSPLDPKDAEKCEKDVQVDCGKEELIKVQEELRNMVEKYKKLIEENAEQKKNLNETEQRLKDERFEKDGLKEELKRNTERVLAILGGDGNVENDDENPSSDSLLMLECRFQNVSQVIINQENEISKLNAYCRTLQRDLDKSFAAQKILLQQQQELQEEGIELKEFMQAEKNALSEALKDAEIEVKRFKLLLIQKDKEVDNKQEECKHLVRISEQRRQDTLALQARLDTIETKGRELLVHQGSNVSGAAVALSGLISRLDGLVEELVTSYSISQQELDDVIFHNEAYSNSSSSPEASPGKFRNILKEKSPSPKRGSSFISAVINAIRNATSQTPFSAQRDISKDTICTDNSNSSELLDSETEPCLMMEPVLEDVVVPDGHSHNMISSGHNMLNCSRLTHSESLNNLSQAILNRQLSEQASMSLTESLNASFTSDMSSVSDYGTCISLVDQVIDVDNLVTRLLKVIRIIQLENEEVMNELQDERDGFCQQVDKQRDTNKIVVKQLKDWEVLGARLKSELKELMQQLSKKNAEIEDTRCELNNQRKEVERLNQDVCELSTALSKAELEAKIKEEEANEALKLWQSHGDMPPNEALGRILVAQNEVTILRNQMSEKEAKLNEVVEEYTNSKQIFTDYFKSTFSETKKQYEVLDNILGVLHSIQPIVSQSPELSVIQQDLEKVCMQSASSIPKLITSPPDCNANAAIAQAMATLGIIPQINTTA